MNIFQKYKIKSELTYSDIGKLLDPPVQRGTACKFIMQPGRCYSSTINRLIDVLDIPKDEAEKEWKKFRTLYKSDRIKNERL